MKRLSLSLATVALLSVSLTTQAGFLDDTLKNCSSSAKW